MSPRRQPAKSACLEGPILEAHIRYRHLTRSLGCGLLPAGRSGNAHVEPSIEHEVERLPAVVGTAVLAPTERRERKRTCQGRDGWEDGTPPPHRDFKERGEVHSPSPRSARNSFPLDGTCLVCGECSLPLFR